MTVGQKGYGNTTYGPAPAYYKSWSGADGRTEVINGKPRTKWNKYSVHITDRSWDKAGTAYPQYGFRLGVGFPGTIGSYLESNQDIKLQARLIKKIREHEFNLGVELGQGKQTMTMLYSSFSRVTRALVHVKHGRIGRAASVLGVQGHRTKLSKKDVSGNWLELQYGWLPFLGSVKDGMDAWASMNSKRKTSVRASVKYGRSLEGSQSPSTYSCMGQVTCRKRIVYEMTERLSASRELGLLDPYSIAWELLPFSFVVDWFIPIGAYLENLNIIPQLEGRFCTTTLVTINVPNGKVYSDPYYKGADVRYREVFFERAVTNGISAALPSFKTLPQIYQPTRLLNAIALVHQRLR